MKTLVFDTGGRPMQLDDLQTLQAETTAAVLGPYLGLGAFIVSGCAVSGPTGGPFDVGPGLVCLDGEFVRFYGQSGVALPAQFERSPLPTADTDQRVYQTGTTRPCIVEYAARLVPVGSTAPDQECVPLTERGGKRWKHVVQEQTYQLGDLLPLAASAWQPADYDATGRGLPYTPAWGWALANGQNGTDDLRQRSVAGYAPGLADYAVGATGGRSSLTLDASHLPPTSPLTPPVATYTGSTAPGTYGLIGNNQGWETKPLPGGGGVAVDVRSPYRALPVRQWVGY
jgi:hypothetical protein